MEPSKKKVVTINDKLKSNNNQMKYLKYFLIAMVLFSGLEKESKATKLLKVLAVDNQSLLLHFQDGYIEYNWDDTISGSCNGWDYYHTEDWALCNDKDQYIPYGEAIHTGIVQKTGTYRITSTDDEKYGKNGKNPVEVYRKSKVWEASFDENKPAMHHWIYLELSDPLTRGNEYTIQIDPDLNSDMNEYAFVYDEYTMESPAIKISNIGYEASAPHKFADIYLWMGDGGKKDYSKHTGNAFHLYDIDSGAIAFTGDFEFRMKNRIEPRTHKDLTGADVWECDFSSFAVPGQYRLVIEGIGCSPDFKIDENVFEEAFKVSMQGMFYQRMGCDSKPVGNYPYSRRPLYKQGVEPAGFEVLISTKNMIHGANPDDRGYYSSSLTGEVAKETWGGWADAYDNDQNPNNYIVVFDILLTYYLNPNKFMDNQLYIPEAANDIPDILDEALWEIDWWLRMRDSKGGYLTGLTNIKTPEIRNYAGAPCAWQGWCVAAGCAMIADCFRLSGNPTLQQAYTDSAIVAYNWALEQTDQMLSDDVKGLRGIDLKMTAAAFLYNLTGETNYEDVLNAFSKVNSTTSFVRSVDNWEQQYATIAYLFTPREVNYPTLQSNMKASIINQAKTHYTNQMNSSPTKAVRWTSSWEGMAQTSNEMSLVAVAHKLTDDHAEKVLFEKGLYAEAEWTLGRNPLGLVHMTGLTNRSITQAFNPGRRDGYPGLTPGWTPYMCRDGWKNSDNIVRCEWYTNRNYPDNKEIWPWGEHFWNSRYNVPNSEATPHQNIRQKIVLYGYIFSMDKNMGGQTNFIPIDTPEKKQMLNVYPNPTDSTTIIDYTVSDPTNIQIAVFDLNGRLVETLIDHKHDTGSYSTKWNSTSNANPINHGTYIVRMILDGTVFSQKISVIR
jgi:endoglucanase